MFFDSLEGMELQANVDKILRTSGAQEAAIGSSRLRSDVEFISHTPGQGEVKINTHVINGKQSVTVDEEGKVHDFAIARALREKKEGHSGVSEAEVAKDAAKIREFNAERLTTFHIKDFNHLPGGFEIEVPQDLYPKKDEALKQEKAPPAADVPIPPKPKTPADQPVAPSDQANTPSETSDHASKISATAAELLKQVHAGDARNASTRLAALPPEQAWEIAREIQRINELEQQKPGANANLSIHIEYLRDEYGKRLAPKEVRESTPVDKIEDKLNRELIQREPGVSDAFASVNQEALEALPLAAKQALHNAGFKFVLALKVTDALPELKGQHPRGYAPQATFDHCPALTDFSKRVCVLAETNLKGDGTVDSSPSDGNGLRHEGGHVLNYVLGSVSASADFQKAYDGDVKRIPEADRIAMAYWLQAEDAGRDETFAESFATICGGSKNHPDIKAQMLKYFPTVAKLIRAKIEEQT